MSDPLLSYAISANQSPIQVSPQTGDRPGDSVTFTWDVTTATQVLLNGETVEGNSATVPVNQTGAFVLQALGQGGPVTSSILVTGSPVKINSFTATTSIVYGNNNNVPVTFAWDVQGANQLLLNNDIVTGQSTSVPINEATTFTLEATGYNGPVYAETGVNVEPVNLTIDVADDYTIMNISISFNANPGTYNVLITQTVVYFGGSPNTTPITQQATTDSFGTIQINQQVGPAQYVNILSVQVTVTGFSSGPLTANYPS